MNQLIKNKARRFIKKHALFDVNYEKLKKAVENLGYTLVAFSHVQNDEDVETVIKNLGLMEATLRSKGFTYANQNYRLVFINEDLGEEEKSIVLAHELGHIVCEHFNAYPIIGNDVKEEHEANEFSHYLLKRSMLRRMQGVVENHKGLAIVIVLAVLVVAVALIIGFFSKREQSYYGNYYITPTGTKYHKENCIFVKNKTTTQRLEVEMFETGMYEACEVCLPDEK